MEFQTDLMERAWPKDDYTATSVGIGNNGWDAGRLGRMLAESVGAWVEYHFDDSAIKSEAERYQLWEKERAGKDEILEEAAGVLKDILQELDLKHDEKGAMDEEEAGVVGLTLLKLSGYLLPLK
jgi:NAD(P)H-hydrate repair Nnr-like enzyme with NAD(P)H-hydrate epimerase domain